MKMEKYQTIETYRDRKGTSAAVFEGTKAANSWKSGKQVTEEEYDLAVSLYGQAPINGRRKHVQ